MGDPFDGFFEDPFDIGEFHEANRGDGKYDSDENYDRFGATEPDIPDDDMDGDFDY